jgi:hypothetical protein
LSFTPLLVVNDKGKVFSGRETLKTAKVTAKVVGDGAGGPSSYVPTSVAPPAPAPPASKISPSVLPAPPAWA